MLTYAFIILQPRFKINKPCLVLYSDVLNIIFMS